MQLFESFCTSESDDSQYLAACVSETLKAGKKHHACEILLCLLEKHEYLLPFSIDTLALYRYLTSISDMVGDLSLRQMRHTASGIRIRYWVRRHTYRSALQDIRNR